MFNENGHLRKPTISETLRYFITGLLFNAVGNGLTVATNMGSAPWTASAANLANATGWSISVFLFTYGAVAAMLTCIILRAVDLPRLFGNMIFLLTFSSIVGLVATFFMHTNIPQLPMIWRTIIDLLAVTFVAIGVSITQRLQLILHPLDDLTNLTRFMFFKGNAMTAQATNFAIPMIISLIVWLATGKLVALNIGTLVSFFCTGIVITYADKWMFPHLDHKLQLSK